MEKKYSLPLIPFLAFFIYTCFCSAQDLREGKNLMQASENKMVELILGAPKITDKNLHIVINALSKINGLKYSSYCEEHKLILLTYDAGVFRTADQVVESLKKQQVTMPLFKKEGSFDIVKEMCNSR